MSHGDAEVGARSGTTNHVSRAQRSPTRRSGPVRSRRSPAGLVVAVTGAADGVGRSLAQRLSGRDDVAAVVAVDERGGDLPGVRWKVVDVRSPELVDAIGGCDTLVHAAVPDVPGDPAWPSLETALARMVDGARTAVIAAAAANVPRVVLVTSAMVYGASKDNPVPLDEDAPLAAVADGAAITALLEVEEIAARARTVHPGLRVTVLRPAVLVGPGVDSVFTRHFEAPRLLVVKDSRPHWQFCHVEDLVGALELAATGAAEGVLTVGCEGYLTQEEVEEATGMRRIELPARIAYGTAERLHRLGMTPAPASELAYTAEPWVVPSTRLRAAGWTPAFDNRAAVAALVECKAQHAAAGSGRRLGRDATLGAAGATVAVLGTAAVVRQIRRQRRGG
jgi:nucleoside-diphosphate-sugar epimerase